MDYASLPPRQKVGYGDFRTAQQVYSFLSPRIVLASKSPQRLRLLQQIVAREKVEVQVSNCSEDRRPYETPHARVQRLAEAKAQAVLELGEFSDTIEFIVGADTEIVHRDDNRGEWRLVGHPRTIEQAEEDLRYLSGKTHLAITGIAVIGKDPETGAIKRVVDCVETKVTFAELDENQIRSYASSKEPLGRAGAYAIQGLGAILIEEIEGSYSNVVGLPLERFTEILADDFQKPIWRFDKVSDWSFPEPIKESTDAERSL
jgi:septum formation protein